MRPRNRCTRHDPHSNFPPGNFRKCLAILEVICGSADLTHPALGQRRATYGFSAELLPQTQRSTLAEPRSSLIGTTRKNR